MPRIIAILLMCTLAPAASGEERGPAAVSVEAAGLAACAPPPRPDAEVAYLSLIVGPDGVADDDAFRVAEGAPCLSLRPPEE